MSFFPRSAWGARKPKATPTRIDGSRRRNYVQHYSTGQELGREDCAQWVREIQNFHMGPKKNFNDIGYNFLVCKHGDVFEGRGWDILGAHAGPKCNAEGIGVCYLGNDDPGMDATPAARSAMRSLWEEASKRFGRALNLKGHRECMATHCPGDELFGWIKAGMPTDQPAPAPTPPSPPPDNRPQTPTFPGAHHFGRGKRNDHVTAWGKILVAIKFKNHHDGNGFQPGPTWSKYDAANTADFQRSEPRLRGDADGIPGPLTWKIGHEKAGYR